MQLTPKTTTWAVLGVLLTTLTLQGYLIYKEYRTQEIRLKVDLNDGFLVAVEEEKASRVDSAVDWFASLLNNEKLVELWADTIGSPYEATRIVYHLRDSTGERASVSFVSDTLVNQFSEIDKSFIINKLLVQARHDTEEGSLFYYTDLLAFLMKEYLTKKITDLPRLESIFNQKVDSYPGLSGYDLQLIPIDSIPLPMSPPGFATLGHNANLLRPAWQVQATFPSILKAAIWRARFAVLGGGISLLLTTVVFLVLLRTLRTQQRLSRVKDEFIGNTSHELQTPIATLMAIHEGFEKYAVLEDAEKTERYLKTAKGQVQRLSRLADQVLRGAQGLRQPTSKREDLALATIQHELDLAYAHSDSVTFEQTCQYPHPTVNTDPDLLRQAIGNLIENGIKYNDKAVAEIQVDWQEYSQGIQIKVTDNGPGIPAKEQGRVFEKFYRISQSGKHAVKGFGMGLFLVKQSVEQLGGTVTLTSQPNKGTCFTILLPQNE